MFACVGECVGVERDKMLSSEVCVCVCVCVCARIKIELWVRETNVTEREISVYAYM